MTTSKITGDSSLESSWPLFWLITRQTTNAMLYIATYAHQTGANDRSSTADAHVCQPLPDLRLRAKARELFRFSLLVHAAPPGDTHQWRRHQLSVLNQIDGPTIPFHDGRCPTAISSVCGKAATLPSVTYARFGAGRSQL